MRKKRRGADLRRIAEPTRPCEHNEPITERPRECFGGNGALADSGRCRQPAIDAECLQPQRRVQDPERDEAHAECETERLCQDRCEGAARPRHSSAEMGRDLEGQRADDDVDHTLLLDDDERRTPMMGAKVAEPTGRGGIGPRKGVLNCTDTGSCAPHTVGWRITREPYGSKKWTRLLCSSSSSWCCCSAAADSSTDVGRKSHPSASRR
jgi:hypothetical protein